MTLDAAILGLNMLVITPFVAWAIIVLIVRKKDKATTGETGDEATFPEGQHDDIDATT